MKRAKPARILAVLVLALAAHGVLLALLAIELPGFAYRPQLGPDRAALIVSLTPLPLPLPNAPPKTSAPAGPKPAKPKPPKPAARAQASPELAANAAPSPPAVAADLPNLARPVFRVWPRPLPGGVDWGGADLGCDDPGLRHMSAQAREDCLKRWGKQDQAKLELPPLIAPDKQAAFDRRIRCRDKYELAGVPVGTAENFKLTLGYNPSLKDCPVGDR